MSNEKKVFRQILEREYSRMKGSNPSFSVRAYAKLLGISSSTMSGVLNGDRKIPKDRIPNILSRLSLDEKEENLFVQSAIEVTPDLKIVAKEAPRALGKVISSDEYEDFMTKWEYFGILNFISTSERDHSFSNISVKLDIPVLEVQKYIGSLHEWGLIENENGRYRRTYHSVESEKNIPSKNLRIAHQNSSDLAIKKMFETDMKFRNFSSTTFVMPKRNISKAKKLLAEFQDKFCSLLEENGSDSVFQLNLQFFPVTAVEAK